MIIHLFPPYLLHTPTFCMSLSLYLLLIHRRDIYLADLLGSLSIAHMHTCLGMTPWNQITYQDVHPRRRLISLSLSSIDRL